MTLIDEVSAGQDADMLLNNPAYKKAISDVKQGIIDSMTESAMGDTSTHNRLVIALQLINQIEASIKTVSQTGQLAKLQLEDSKVKQIRKVIGL